MLKSVDKFLWIAPTITSDVLSLAKNTTWLVSNTNVNWSRMWINILN